jgi:two-component system cell cycle response regulator
MGVTAIQEGLLTQEKMRLLSVLARQCSLVMENCLLYEDLRKRNDSLEKYNKQIQYLSQRDPLTGCYNRRYMNEHLPREIRRARRYRRSLSLALCDIDFFKNINDSYGHTFGDKTLQQFVKSLNELIRTDSDWLVRYGGEEFLLVLPETSLDNALHLAERLRCRIADKEFEYQGETARITASFGLIGFGAEPFPEKVPAENLLRHVDANLYRAKNEGRNRVVGSAYEPAGAPA